MVDDISILLKIGMKEWLCILREYLMKSLVFNQLFGYAATQNTALVIPGSG